MASEQNDSYLRPRPRAVETDDFTADRADLPDITLGSTMCDMVDDGPPELEEFRHPPVWEDGGVNRNIFTNTNS